MIALFLLSEAMATEIGEDRFIGLGAVLGVPSGISAKFHLGGPLHAVDAALGSAFSSRSGFYLHGTYLIHPTVLHSQAEFDLSWHFGGGGYLISQLSEVGGRAPIGLDLNLNDVPVQVFGDLALQLSIIPNINAWLSAGVGVRYYF